MMVCGQHMMLILQASHKGIYKASACESLFEPANAMSQLCRSCGDQLQRFCVMVCCEHQSFRDVRRSAQMFWRVSLSVNLS